MGGVPARALLVKAGRAGAASTAEEAELMEAEGPEAGGIMAVPPSHHCSLFYLLHRLNKGA